MLNFITATAEAPAGGSLLSLLITFLPMIAIFYFLLIRPENKRKKEAEAMRSAMKKGDKITTIGGIIGIVVDIKEDKIVIESGADQVRIELAKWAVSSNDSADAAAKEQAKKAAEEKAKAKAAKKAEM